MASALRPVAVAIVGPTACGKSAVALRLAEALGGEVISCDSVQVYRGFEIGCAKPSAAERGRVPHHLLDVVEWNDPFDAQRYVDLAQAALGDIRRRGRLPIVCGGTGLYLRALRYGLVDIPRAPKQLRERLEAEEDAEPGCLYRRLLHLDPDTARSTEPHNLVHIVRALEVMEVMGEPASRVRGRHGFRGERNSMLVLGLTCAPDLLRRRIATRAAHMLEQGLLEEVRGLLAAGVAPACRPMQAVGYKEARDVVLGRAGEEGLGERIARSTWAYARRQRTWLRKERDVRAVAADVADDAYAAVRALVEQIVV